MIPHVDGPMPLYSEKKPFSLMVFLHAVKHTVVLFHLAQIGTKDRTDVDERIHKGIGDTTSSRTTGNLRHGEQAKICVLAVFWEHLLDVVLERQVERGGGNVTDAVCNL